MFQSRVLICFLLSLLLSGCWESATRLLPLGLSASPVGGAAGFLWVMTGPDASAVMDEEDLAYVFIRRPGQDISFEVHALMEEHIGVIARFAPYSWTRDAEEIRGWILELQMPVDEREADHAERKGAEYYWLTRDEDRWLRHGSGLKNRDPRRKPASLEALLKVIRDEHAAGTMEVNEASSMIPLSEDALKRLRAVGRP